MMMIGCGTQQDVYSDKDGERPPIFKLISSGMAKFSKAACHRRSRILSVVLQVRRPCCEFQINPDQPPTTASHIHTQEPRQMRSKSTLPSIFLHSHQLIQARHEPHTVQVRAKVREMCHAAAGQAAHIIDALTAVLSRIMLTKMQLEHIYEGRCCFGNEKSSCRAKTADAFEVYWRVSAIDL